MMNYLAVCITDSHNQCMLLECIYIIPQEALSNKNYPKAISKSTWCGNGETTYEATSGSAKNWAKQVNSKCHGDGVRNTTK